MLEGHFQTQPAQLRPPLNRPFSFFTSCSLVLLPASSVEVRAACLPSANTASSPSVGCHPMNSTYMVATTDNHHVARQEEQVAFLKMSNLLPVPHSMRSTALQEGAMRCTQSSWDCIMTCPSLPRGGCLTSYPRAL